jgi:hypothetical protein
MIKTIARPEVNKVRFTQAGPITRTHARTHACMHAPMQDNTIIKLSFTSFLQSQVIRHCVIVL